MRKSQRIIDQTNTKKKKETNLIYEIQRISDIVFQTTNFKNPPLYVLPYAIGMKHFLYDDDKCITFLRSIDPSYVTVWHNLKDGAHKADFWRYVILYEYGGIYIDIKIIPYVELKSVFESYSDKYTWYTCKAGLDNSVFNGIIATPPKNPILKLCIDHICYCSNRESCTKKYDCFCAYLNNLIIQQYNKISESVWENKSSRCILLEERVGEQLGDCECAGFKNLDRYNLCCNAYLNNKLVFCIRDPSYPNSWS